MADAGFDAKAWQKVHDENTSEIHRLWKDSGCGKASPRTRTHVDGTLRKLAKELSFDWMIPLWRSTSATVHMYGSDFLFEDRGDGTSDIVWAQPRFRAAWLSFLGASYSYLTTTAAGVLDPSAVVRPRVRFHESMRSIIENAMLKKAVDGRLRSVSRSRRIGSSSGAVVEERELRATAAVPCNIRVRLDNLFRDKARMGAIADLTALKYRSPTLLR